MTEEAKEKRRAYRREWYAKNKGKQKEYSERYWERQAAKECTNIEKIPENEVKL